MLALRFEIGLLGVQLEDLVLRIHPALLRLQGERVRPVRSLGQDVGQVEDAQRIERSEDQRDEDRRRQQRQRDSLELPELACAVDVGCLVELGRNDL